MFTISSTISAFKAFFYVDSASAGVFNRTFLIVLQIQFLFSDDIL